jgi:Family of unknown function (DUF5871)
MEFGSPVKVPDGRYFLKVSGARMQLNGLSVDSFMCKPILLGLTDTQVETIKNLESQVLVAAKERSAEWFGRDIPEATIAKAFQSALNSNTLEAALQTAKGKVLTSFWKKDQDSDWSKADAIVELSGIWFLKRSFGPIFKILQVKESKNRSAEYLFKDDNSDVEDYLD